MPQELWLWLGRCSALLAVVVTGVVLLPALFQPAYFRRHFFFLFYVAIVCIYLQVAPAFAQVGTPPATVFVYRMRQIQDYREQYGWLQVSALLAFQLPLILAYFASFRPVTGSTVVGHRHRARALALVMTLFALSFVAVMLRHQLWYLRIGDALTDRLLELPSLEFVVFRLFQECGLFVVGLTLFAWRFSHGATRRWCLVAFATVTTVFGAFNLLNSRWFVTSLLVCLVGWFVASSPASGRRVHITRLASLALVGMLAAYLSVVVVNVRNARDGVGLATLSPVQGGIFADTQGINRLDCIDLMARIQRPLHEQGPALFRSWGQVTWLLWRFVDPEGFDRYRLTRQTTAKSYLMREYLGIDVTDYFSCTATDLYGNFKLPGLLIGGLVLGGVFAWTTTTLAAPRGGTALVLAIFVLTQIVIFDQEAVFTFFGWIRKVPVLLVAVALRPFAEAPGP